MKSKISKIISATSFAMLTPFVVLASNGNFSGTAFENLIAFVQRMLKSIFPIITALMILLLAWQVWLFLKDDAGDEKKAIHKSGIIKAIIALFLWFTFFGIINVVADSFGLDVGEDVTTQDVTSVVF